ncbi:MAG TPA: hypothetical protein VIL06_00510 [Coriobacteriia bacterium]
MARSVTTRQVKRAFHGSSADARRADASRDAVVPPCSVARYAESAVRRHPTAAIRRANATAATAIARRRRTAVTGVRRAILLMAG